MSASDPLILTLQMEEAAFDRFENLRRRHFPEALNVIPAHVTLFHHLPGEDEGMVMQTIASLAARQAPPEVTVRGVRKTGRGVAYELESPALSAFRAAAADAFRGHLTAQDRQGWRPHVTVQNKVEPAAARALHAELSASFVPYSFSAPGVLLWRYRGGPWEPLAALLFAAEHRGEVEV